DRLRAARERVGVVAISGAVGTYSLIDPSVEVAAAHGENSGASPHRSPPVGAVRDHASPAGDCPRAATS
ncbi:hypothetical protein E9564_22540, partial [Blastococcus sp. MG754427]|nr:hypothetical protein [Blastococcus sp. MG754427]